MLNKKNWIKQSKTAIFIIEFLLCVFMLKKWDFPNNNGTSFKIEILISIETLHKLGNFSSHYWLALIYNIFDLFQINNTFFTTNNNYIEVIVGINLKKVNNIINFQVIYLIFFIN